MCDDEGEDEDGKEGEWEDEHVEEAVVPPSYAVPHPWTVVVKALCVDRDRHSKVGWEKFIFEKSMASSFIYLSHHVAATVIYAPHAVFMFKSSILTGQLIKNK